MKICIIGQPRSRCSLLKETLSIFYNIPVIIELEKYQDKIRNTPSTANNFDRIFNKIQCYTDGVIRIHPFQLSLKNNVVPFNLLNFNQYDKIYFTSRKNKADHLSSLLVARRLKKFTFFLNETIPRLSVMDFSLEELQYTMTSLIFEELVEENIKKFLLTNGVLWEHIYYEDMKEYLNTNFANIDVSILETFFDYKSIVAQYSELENIYYDLKDEVTKRFYRHNPQLL